MTIIVNGQYIFQKDNLFQMKTKEFPSKAFHDVLLQKKIKNNLKPFLEEYDKLNIPWIYESISILKTNFDNPSVKPQIKFSSMLAVKCLVETAQYVTIQFIEAYLLPNILKIATFQPQSPDQNRGANLFLKRGQQNEELQKLGFNVVKLATETILVLAIIKPKKFYEFEEVKDPSQFSLAMRQIKNTLKHPPGQLAIYKEVPQKRKLFVQNILKFDDDAIGKYQQFASGIFLDGLKHNFTKKNDLDIRDLLKTGDTPIVSATLDLCNQALTKSTSCGVIKGVLQFLTMLIQTGNYHPVLFLYQNGNIKSLVEAAIALPGKDIQRGQKFLPQKKGTPDEKQALYVQFLKDLQFWAKTDAGRDITNPAKPSKIALYYKLLKHQKNIIFPSNPNLKKTIAGIQQKKKYFQQSNKRLHQQILTEIKQPKQDSLTKNVKLASTWSVVSDSPKSMKSGVNQSKQESKMQVSPRKQESSLESNNQIKKQAPKMEYQTPGNDSQHPTFPVMMRGLQQLQKKLQNLNKSQKQLPNAMDHINQQNSRLGDGCESPHLDSQQFEIVTQKYFVISDVTQQINKIYKQYKLSNINFIDFSNKTQTVLFQAGLISKKQIKVEQKKPQKIKQPEKPIIKKQSVTSINAERQKMASKQRIQISDEKIGGYMKESRNKENKPKQEIVSYQNLKTNNHQNFRLPNQLPSASKISEEQQKQAYQELKRSSVSHTSSQHRRSARMQRPKKQPQRQQKVQFQVSSMGRQSKFSSPPKHDGNLLDDLSIQVSQVREQIQSPEHINSRPSFNKINLNNRNSQTGFPQRNNGSHVKIESPVVNKNFILSEHSNKSRSFSQINDVRVNNEFNQDDDDQLIQCPDLNPLNNSYHNDQKNNTMKKPTYKTFKDALNTDGFDFKKGKKEKIFWLSSETSSLLKPAANDNNSRSRAMTKVSVPEILDERNKKHQQEIRLLQKDRDRKIKQLKYQLANAEEVKSQLSVKLKERDSQIVSLREKSDYISDKSSYKPEPMNYIDDQNYVLKKLNAASQQGASRRRQFSHNQRSKSYSVLRNQGVLINTKVYDQYFLKFKTQKQKKMHLKNKQLLYKDENIQIGCMGHREGQSYKVTIFITPEIDIILDKVGVENDKNLEIRTQAGSNISIKKRKQQRIFFIVDINNIPYEIPYVYFFYNINGRDKKIRVFLPVAFHKFVKIVDIDTNYLIEYFKNNQIMRGEEIPYSKRALKNLDNIQDYFPHITKLNIDSAGEIVYGGQAQFHRYSFLMKISIKPNQFLYIQTVNHKKDQSPELKQAIQFYIATINNFLMKDIEMK